jgi:hypothetical protein
MAVIPSHLNFICANDEIENVRGRQNKKTICIELFNYLKDNALEFTNANPKFKQIVINKCREFKTQEFDQEDLVKLSDELLKALKSYYIPDGYRNTYDRLTLLKKIFNENKMTLTKELWDKYHEWSSEYKPTQSVNRYEKMIRFLENNKKFISTNI